MSNIEQCIRPTLVVFQGGALDSSSPLERQVVAAQQAATLDLLSDAAESAAFDRAVLVTEDERLAQAASALAATRPQLRLDVVPHALERFHFGEVLKALCKAHGLERVVYIGGGAMPLGTVDDLRQLAEAVSGLGECVVANNLYSADMVAFWPASALDRISLPAGDNDLAWLLHFHAGLSFAPLPRTLATQFDIDTPADLATLWWATRTPPLDHLLGARLGLALDAVPVDLPMLADSVQKAYKVMATRRAEVLVAGRVSSWVWRRLEANLPCQTRIISEERGMVASGREARGEVVSLLGLHADAAGLPGLVRSFESVANAAFIDSRVLFAHYQLNLPKSDRFASDALLPEQVADPWARQLTELAMSASIPVTLGGHSLVSSGIWALSERVRGSASAL